ncbi:immunity 53 family protein [Deinococcus koreensis]|uniref:Rhodanese-related sulfurtransferase n=1 Tax=Deinococcus koreensis TaxID=2054903 RepID=A0A2K3V0X9_9DEIO|nr:immunity 53 family protein [Deinococcus koreensis]PNY82442.1 rhodanese-related sulfurtransferase [Deinococcus koreensis]
MTPQPGVTLRETYIASALRTADPIQWLQGWYYAMCDGDWEHGSGPNISTLDNPGWAVKIDLSKTYLSTRPFKVCQIERHQDDWLNCTVSQGCFRAFGGPVNLSEIVDIFRAWAEPGLEIKSSIYPKLLKE